MTNRLSRREMLKRTVVAGAVATVPLRQGNVRAEQHTGQPVFETLTQGEGKTLSAVVARLMPADENGPGATEAKADRYIDRALSGSLRSSLNTYRQGFVALNRYAESIYGSQFSDLSIEAQDQVLSDLEDDTATGFSPNASSFFEVVRSHTIQGVFSDPAYGGNDDFVGWKLLGYPGVRTSVTADLQRMDFAPTARQISAYDFPAFADLKIRRTNGR